MLHKVTRHIILVAFFLTSCGDSKDETSPTFDPIDASMAHMAYLSDIVGQRIAGEPGETAALAYIREEFLHSGYQPEIQPFSAAYLDSTVSSNNIIAVLKGKSEQEIIVGAHYDSVDVGKGYIDNASGVGLLLATAKRLKESLPPFTIRFIAFGAEEIGLFGSRHYATNMSDIEVANTIGVVNLDCIVGGDKIYAYGGMDEQGWMRDQALNIATKLQIDLQTNPGLNPDYPRGTTGDWSDHAPFKYRGLSYLYFETTNWEIGDLTGLLQTAKFGEIYHTENDNFTFLDREYPGRIESQLGNFAVVLEEFLLTATPPESTTKILRREITQPDNIQTYYLHRNGTPFEH